MNTIINTESGERLSFFKLFSQKKYKIVIPIIQRDFAQGRKATKEVRDSFLDALFKYLNENKSNRDLDFVYGSIAQVEDSVYFIPLDGQQRLTTLFLLHWYLYQISDNSEKKNEFIQAILNDGKTMFAYETRSSSTEFCNALANNIIDFNSLLVSDIDPRGISLENSLSKTIRNSAWFFLSWQYDPTIQSMLIMLDAIHKKFAKSKFFFERLLDNQNPIITFLFLNLGDFKLTDDLYIKMNSRGKPLTPFENFKAKYEQYLETVKSSRQYFLKFNPKEVSIKEYFSYNIDTKWANLFWQYRTLQRGANEVFDTFDEELMNFVRVVFTNQYAINTEITTKDKNPSLEYLLGTSVARKENKDYSDIISYHKYKDLNVIVDKEDYEKFTKLIEEVTDDTERHQLTENFNRSIKLSVDCTMNLIDSLNCLTNGNDKIKHHLPNNYNFYFNESEVFENALKHSFESNHQRICFHAYLRYLIVNKHDYNGINQWMRVIHNLTHPENTIIDNASDVAFAVKSVEAMISHSENILEYLKQNRKIDFFSPAQVLEEKIKAHLITKNADWQNSIELVEKHKYFNGQIGFILEFAGIIQYFEKFNTCNWSDKENIEYYNKFSDYAQKAAIIFEESYDKRINNKDYIFERAVLTKGDYLTIASQNRKNLLCTSVVKNNIKRDHSWKRLLRYSDDEWINKRLLVKQIFDDSRLDKKDVVSSLSLICRDRTETWRDCFIDCPDILAYCKQGFIRFEDDNQILLYGESQSNFYHAEMYTYYLWKKYIEPYRTRFEPFKVRYSEVKSIDEYACIILDSFCYKRIHYKMEVHYSCDGIELMFFKAKGDLSSHLYGDEILFILNKLHFEWSDNDAAYCFLCNTVEQAASKLQSITNRLNSLQDN